MVDCLLVAYKTDFTPFGKDALSLILNNLYSLFQILNAFLQSTFFPVYGSQVGQRCPMETFVIHGHLLREEFFVAAFCLIKAPRFKKDLCYHELTQECASFRPSTGARICTDVRIMHQQWDDHHHFHGLGKGVKCASGIFLDHFLCVCIVLHYEIYAGYGCILDGSKLKFGHGCDGLDPAYVIQCGCPVSPNCCDDACRFIHVDLRNLVAVMKARRRLLQEGKGIIDFLLYLVVIGAEIDHVPRLEGMELRK